MFDKYVPAEFEAKWRERWLKADLFLTREDAGRPKFYGLDFFPYPSGAGLSVGHARNYVPTDVTCRLKFMQGYNVLHPMGFDAFGLPAENEAIKRKSHPAPMIENYAANYKRQMDLIGIGFDWSRSFKSSDPSYYKWTQWIFEILYQRGLAFRKLGAVNWDPVDKTVLADEEVIAGRAERSGAIVEKKWIPQWYFKITDYAQQLIDDLDLIDWPDGIKAMQRNWIGRSEGCQFTFAVAGTGKKEEVYDLDSEERGFERALHFDVFTTRIDTIFGVTFCVLAPEHAILELLPVTEEDRARIKEYQEQAKLLSDIDRTAENREKTGVFTGAYAVHPFTGKHVPIWIADYVLATYGTGAIMAVPGHDQRDFDFASKFGIDIVPVIIGEGGLDEVQTFFGEGKAFETKEGTLVNSSYYDGQTVADAQHNLGVRLETDGIGNRKIQYKLRDWLISRQRYWGCPIPVIHTKDGEEQLVPLADLPVELPYVESYEPSGDGSSPLAHIPEFVNCTDRDGRLARRETDTMGGFACSSWYFLRFCDPENYEKAWDQERVNYWMPVDVYVGGAEHAVMHLLYARFWTKVLFDAGYVTVREPFSTLKNQGQVLASTPYRKPREGERLEVGEEGILVSFDEARLLPEEDLTWRWVRMSKSKGNVVTPDEAVENYGADALRMYLLFVAPFHADVQWSNEGMQGMVRFLSRIFKFASEIKPYFVADWKDVVSFEEFDDTGKAVRRSTHKTIRNCTKDLEDFGYNTYVSWLMKYLNELNEQLDRARTRLGTDRSLALAFSEALESLILMISPGAPHSADEIWESLGQEGFTYHREWPSHDEELAKDSEVTIAVQVNGKLRDTLQVAADAGEDEIKAMAFESVKVKAYTDGKEVKKVIVIPKRLVNIVVAG
ncbi:MAG: leucine--tRNA ligase [Armatimonadetes bacterium]|nr:leucine--tRNA ligase [Armatimonadota bacterium]